MERFREVRESVVPDLNELSKGNRMNASAKIINNVAMNQNIIRCCISVCRYLRDHVNAAYLVRLKDHLALQLRVCAPY